MGEDQREHLELMRDVAERFNRRFGEVLVVPEHRIPAVGARIADLQDPTRKMSTTGATDAGHGRTCSTSPTRIVKKFRRAVTDSGTEIACAARTRPGITNLIEIYAAVTARDARGGRGRVRRRARATGTSRPPSGRPWRSTWPPSASATPSCAATRRRSRSCWPTGAEKARAIASGVVADVREVMGVGPVRRSVVACGRHDLGGPRTSSSTSTSSRGRSTSCCRSSCARSSTCWRSTSRTS